MELLYIWINQSKNGFIVEQGFNFYSEFQFYIQIQTEPQRYILSFSDMSKHTPKINYGGNVKNISVLVGENGTGKTTLFHSLYNLSHLPKKGDSNYEQGKKILIFRSNKGIKIIHNLDSDEFVNNTHFTEQNFNLATPDEEDPIWEFLEEQTIIFFSNSMYGFDSNAFSSHQQVNQICLTFDCKIRGMPHSDSGACRTINPGHAAHSFRRMPHTF